MPNFFRLPKSKLFLIAEYNRYLTLLVGLIPVNVQNNEESGASYFAEVTPVDLSNPALEAGIMLMNELIALKRAILKYPTMEESEAVFQKTLIFAQHLFSKAKDDIESYQLTPAHAQLMAFKDTLTAARALVDEPGSNHAKGLDQSIKTLIVAIKKDPCPITNRLLYGFAGSLAIFVGVSICASTLALLLASPLSLAGFGSVASVVLGGISGTLISTGIQLLRAAFSPKPQQTPQELELVNCGKETAKGLMKFSRNYSTLFAARASSPVNEVSGRSLSSGQGLGF